MNQVKERRIKLKEAARLALDRHFKFYQIVFLPIYILSVLAWFLDRNYTDDYTTKGAIALGVYGVITCIISIIQIGVMFSAIDLGRRKAAYQEPVNKSLIIFSRGDYFLNGIGLSILVGVMVSLWSLLLIVPGIIKAQAYSQAVYIYRDHLDQGDKISYMKAISLSRELMDGHKWEYFILQLSFLGWYLACAFVLPILWVYPYNAQTLANFYVDLTKPAEPEVANPGIEIFTPEASKESKE